MGKILDLIKKHGLTTLGTIIAVDGYRRSVFSHHKELKTIKAETAQQIKEYSDKILDGSAKPSLIFMFVGVGSSKDGAHYHQSRKAEWVRVEEGINKNSIFGDLDGYLEWYKEIVSSLAPDQLVALVNIIGFFALFTTLYSMVIINIGNNFLDRWNIEKRYPKLFKYIQYKKKVNEYSMKFHFFFFIYNSINMVMFKYLYAVVKIFYIKLYGYCC